MPIYNERKTLLAIVAAVRAVPIRKELVLVDDGSKDGSRELLDEIAAQFPDVRVVKHERNQGKGAALKTGFQHARGDFVVIQDADLEYDPNDYPLLLQPLVVAKRMWSMARDSLLIHLSQTVAATTFIIT